MITTNCHCGAIHISVPRKPTQLTNCNCSICRRLGTLWAYYPMEEVQVSGHPALTEAYIQGDRMLRMVRCRTCGCTTHWEPLDTAESQGMAEDMPNRMGVNMRNFAPEQLGTLSIRMLDGADTWKSWIWEPPAEDR